MIQIRPYKQGDESQILALIQDVFDEYEIGQRVEDAQDLKDIPAFFDFSNGGGMWILEDDGKVIGTIGLRKISEDECYFSRFYVNKRYRGQGWGSKLWHHRAEYLKHFTYKRAYATSYHAFQEALAFYESHGYTEIEKESFPVKTRWADKFFVKELA